MKEPMTWPRRALGLTKLSETYLLAYLKLENISIRTSTVRTRISINMKESYPIISLDIALSHNVPPKSGKKYPGYSMWPYTGSHWATDTVGR